MPPHVKAAFEGRDGILQGLTEGKVWIDHSTTDYNQMMEFNEMVKAKGAYAIEAPITGGLAALKKGQMTVLLAGDETQTRIVRVTLIVVIHDWIFHRKRIGQALRPLH